MDPDKEIEIEVLPFLRVYKSGRVERLMGTDIVPAGLDPATGVTSKDVVIDPPTGLSARLYLPHLSAGPPKPAGEKKRLPVLIYIHGGGFCVQSAFSPTYQPFLNTLVSRANVVAVSVNYRLPPEDPLPAAYDDCWAALEWVASHARRGSPEPWLAEHADLGRVFLGGDSAGGNIAHNVAMRAASNGRSVGARVQGVVLVHAFFWGSKPVGSEPAEPAKRAEAEKLWAFVCPSSSGIDDPRINPMAEGAPALARLAGERALVCVATKDDFCDRGLAYYEALGSGWHGAANLMKSVDEGHVFHLKKPASASALELMSRIVSFIARGCRDSFPSFHFLE